MLLKTTRKMKNSFTIASLKYVVAVTNPKTAEIEEVEKEAQNLELFKLHRTNISHSKFAFNLSSRGNEDLQAIMEDAVKYVKLCVVDPKLRDEISNDAFACVSLFRSDEVQNDLNDFFTLISLHMGIQKEEKSRQK